jgi:hypothetical protein
MKSFRNSFGSLAIIGGLIGSLNFIHAQTTAKAVQAVSMDDMAVVLQAIEETMPVAAESVPRCGTFYSAFYSAQFPNWPPLPGNINNVPAWNLGDGVWLLDDLDQPQAQMQAMAGTRMTMDVPVPGDGGDSGTNTFTFNESSFTVDYGTNLWIRMDGISSGNLVGIMSNSIAGTPYEIQSCENLLGAWSSEGEPVYGLETTNWTPFNVAMNNRTNLFVRIKSWADSTGSGIPDWWWLQYFGSVGGDPFAFDSYGWTLLQDFEAGYNPTVFHTPPAPRGLTVSLNQLGQTVAISWLPSAGAVAGYTVEKTYQPFFYSSPQISDFSTTTPNYLDSLAGDSPDPDSGYAYDVTYRVQAQYSSGGASAWSASVPLQQATLSGSIVPGSNGAPYLLVSGLPKTAATVRLVYYDQIASLNHNDFSFNTSRDIPIADFTNGLYPLPASWQSAGVDAYGYNNTPNQIQSVDADGNPSAVSWLNYVVWSPPFYDGRAQLKQNLIFLLRESNANGPFNCAVFGTNGQETASISMPSAYAYVGFYGFPPKCYDNYFDTELDVLRPFTDNYFYRNFVFNTADVDVDGNITTGASTGYDYWTQNYSLILQQPATYQFQSSMTNQSTIPALLATNNTQWLFSDPFWLNDYGASVALIVGINWDPGLDYSMINNVRNFFGLPFRSTELAYQAYDSGGFGLGYLDTYTLYPGNSVNIIGLNFYTETAQPQFQTVEYDFWQPNDQCGWPEPTKDWLPGHPNFSPTNTSRLMIAPVGSSITVAGYAKLAIQNGYSGAYGYLAQYFDKAYKIANGIVTTNTTGVLSPYGNFSATEPGPAALVTMPDVDTGARGTCTVSVASIQVDKNSDGIMDLSFSGPDATSQASPYRVWANSGHCEPGSGGSLDTDLPVPPNSPNYSAGEITCQRDLENFFRLWVCGLPALPANQGYTITLSMSPVSGSPAINLYDSVETNGGTGYLTDTNIAFQQCLAYAHGSSPYNVYYTGPGAPIAKITPSSSFTFPASYFTNSGNKYFLFEGACTNGSGELMMTISQNGNVIAQTGVWLDLHDVKDFYEQAVITNNTSGSISNWTSGIEMVKPATSALGDDTNLIIFVHGINVDNWDWLDDSDTVFKRLYWAGYHGKFMTVKWPCYFLTPPRPVTFDVFNLSEANAYKASTSLTTYLNQLRSRYPGYHLNLFVHSQGNAVASEAIKNGAPFDTYILTQGAISDGAYDVNATNYPVLVNEEYGKKITPEWQPMGYRGVYTNSNFSGKIVNFYNTNDPVLAVWIVDQVDLKPSGGYFYDGVNCRYTISSNIVTDFQETRSMVSRSRSLSVGQSPPESPHGVIKSAVDLNTRYGFNNAFPADHSAQWTWPIQTTTGYYLQLLDSIKP